VLPLQSVEASLAELKRVNALGFKAAAVRPCFWNGRYPTLPEFDPSAELSRGRGDRHATRSPRARR